MLLTLVLNDTEAVNDPVAVSSIVSLFETTMLALVVTLGEELGDREVLLLTELLEEGDGVVLWLMEGEVEELDDGDNVGDAEEERVSLFVLDWLGVLEALCVVVEVMEPLVLAEVECVMDCDGDNDELPVMVLLSEADGDMLVVEDNEPLIDQE